MEKLLLGIGTDVFDKVKESSYELHLFFSSSVFSWVFELIQWNAAVLDSSCHTVRNKTQSRSCIAKHNKQSFFYCLMSNVLKCLYIFTIRYINYSQCTVRKRRGS